MDPLLLWSFVFWEFAELLCEYAFTPNISFFVYLSEKLINVHRFWINSRCLHSSNDQLLSQFINHIFRQFRLLEHFLPQDHFAFGFVFRFSFSGLGFFSSGLESISSRCSRSCISFFLSPCLLVVFFFQSWCGLFYSDFEEFFSPFFAHSEFQLILTCTIKSSSQ